MTYTLATAALVGLYFGAVAVAAELVHTRLPSAGAWGLIAAIIITAQLFEPLKRAIQDGSTASSTTSAMTIARR